MADAQNAGYRLLSFKYTPPPAQKPLQPTDKPGKDVPRTSTDEDLLSLASLLTSLPEIEEIPDTTAPNTKPVPTECDQNHEAKSTFTTFLLFPYLPAELRLKIWHLSFLPRVVEIRAMQYTHFASHSSSQQVLWQSLNSNPAALAVSIEAREAALAHFRLALPIAMTSNSTSTSTTSTTSTSTSPSTPFTPFTPATKLTPSPFTLAAATTPRLFHHPRPSTTLLHRTLYLAPEHDTPCLLNAASTLLAPLLDALRAADPLGAGVEQLGLSVRMWGYGGSALVLRKLGADDGVLSGLRALVLFMYGDRLPPVEWREGKGAGGRRCALVGCASEGDGGWYGYQVWRGGQGGQFWDGNGRALRIGKEGREVRVVDLVFEEGW